MFGEDGFGVELHALDPQRLVAHPHDFAVVGPRGDVQTIRQAFGGTIVRAKELMHGKTSMIHHLDTGVFKGLPNPFRATRYHSLVIERESLPDCLEITAWTDDGEIMGVRHTTLAVEGVQFHPESILTEHGHAMLANFLKEKT